MPNVLISPFVKRTSEYAVPDFCNSSQPCSLSRMQRRQLTVVTLALILVVGQSRSLNSCENPNALWKKHGPSYYWITSDLDYGDAKAECENVDGGQLAEFIEESTLDLYDQPGLCGKNLVFSSHYVVRQILDRKAMVCLILCPFYVLCLI